MNRTTRFLSAAALAVLAGSAHADPAVALDYHAKAKNCPSADRFADEVSAKLGFVPWKTQAATAIRVRITEDGSDLVGTIEQPDGTSKVLRAASCAKLDELLVTAAAVALDRPTTNLAAPEPVRRLKRLEGEVDPDRLVTVQLHAKDGRELEISRVLSATVLRGYGVAAAAVQFQKLCKAPCTARLPQGSHTFIVSDLANDASASEDATIRVNSTLEIGYTSHAEERRITTSRTKWGMLIGFLAGTAATAYLVEAELADASRALHSLDLVGGMLGGLAGGVIGLVSGPGTPADETTITVRPGLTAGF